VEQTQEEELTAAMDLRREYRDLLKSPAWVRLAEIIKVQCESRLGDVLQPAKGLDSLVSMEYEKGVRAGMLLVSQLPSVILEGLDDEIETLSQMIEDEDNAAGN